VAYGACPVRESAAQLLLDYGVVMKRLLVAAVATAALAGGAWADPLGDAKAGLKALDGGDYTSAIKLFTAALDSGKLVKADRELAYVKRSEAHLAASDPRAALADANIALDLDPQDKEAMATRDRAQALLTPPPAAPGPDTDKVKADYDAAQAKYQAQQQAYEAQKQTDADAYAKQVADYKAADAKHQADVAAWEACKADSLKCAATGAPTTTAQAAPSPAKAAPAPAKPAVEQAANPAPKPDVQQTAKAAAKPAGKPADLPPIAGVGSY
jgi:hypothetical protein